METIKSYTDIEQSKKLAEILPLESADMFYEEVCNLPKAIVGNYILHNQCMEDRDYKKLSNPVLSPAWSLSALIEEIPEVINFDDDESDCALEILKESGLYYLSYGNPLEGEKLNIEPQENFVDACVAMIEKLKELNLL